MNAIKKFFKSLTPFEIILWSGSLVTVVLAFVLTRNTGYIQLAASLVGACMLMLNAKGNVWGQVLSVVFSAFYGTVSWFAQYYGEMITYLGMSAPIALITVFVWLKHPSAKKEEVKIRKTDGKELILALALGIAVSVVFYVILKALHTANLLISTFSVFTSFVASWLTLRRSTLYALVYALNDLTLIVLWAFATIENFEYLSMTVCFIVFFINDAYGLFNWIRLYNKQKLQ